MLAAMKIIAATSSIVIVVITTDYQLSAVFLQVLVYRLNQIPVLDALACAIVNAHITNEIWFHSLTVTCLPSISHLHSLNETTRRLKKNANTRTQVFIQLFTVFNSSSLSVYLQKAVTDASKMAAAAKGGAGGCWPHTQSWRLQRGSMVST
jgi:hypothetical protein